MGYAYTHVRMLAFWGGRRGRAGTLLCVGAGGRRAVEKRSRAEASGRHTVGSGRRSAESARLVVVKDGRRGSASERVGVQQQPVWAAGPLSQPGQAVGGWMSVTHSHSGALANPHLATAPRRKARRWSEPLSPPCCLLVSLQHPLPAPSGFRLPARQQLPVPASATGPAASPSPQASLPLRQSARRHWCELRPSRRHNHIPQWFPLSFQE